MKAIQSGDPVLYGKLFSSGPTPVHRVGYELGSACTHLAQDWHVHLFVRSTLDARVALTVLPFQTIWNTPTTLRGRLLLNLYNMTPRSGLRRCQGCRVVGTVVKYLRIWTAVCLKSHLGCSVVQIDQSHQPPIDDETSLKRNST